jgi:hypothetical protein
VGTIVAERPCGEVDILGRWFKLDVTDQFPPVQFEELQVSLGAVVLLRVL